MFNLLSTKLEIFLLFVFCFFLLRYYCSFFSEENYPSGIRSFFYFSKDHMRIRTHGPLMNSRRISRHWNYYYGKNAAISIRLLHERKHSIQSYRLHITTGEREIGGNWPGRVPDGEKPLLLQGGLEQGCLDSSRRQNSQRIH